MKLPGARPGKLNVYECEHESIDDKDQDKCNFDLACYPRAYHRVTIMAQK
jgi:hypothetical protein